MKTTALSIAINGQGGLKADISIPDHAKAVVIFSHGSGSSRFSPRNRYVAESFHKNNFATVLTDLLTEREERTYVNRFDFTLLTERLLSATNYTTQFSDLKNLPVGYFGASTGAAAALKAAARLPGVIQAVVSRGGRPDLVTADLAAVKAPTLLIAGSLDKDIIKLNKAAYSRLSCEKDLQIVSGARHLFEEPGKLNQVADLASNWFNKFLVLPKKTTK